MEIDLASARILFGRAQEEVGRLNALHGELSWDFEKWQTDDGEFVWGIRRREDRVREASLSLWVTATLSISVLDHAMFALWLSRGGGDEREARKVFFPWNMLDDQYQRTCGNLPANITDEDKAVLAGVREEFRDRFIYIDAMRKIANTGKHRQIVKARQIILAVKVSIDGATPVIWDTPNGDPDSVEPIALHISNVDKRVELIAVVLKPNLDGYRIDIPEEEASYLEYVQHDHSNIIATSFSFMTLVLNGLAGA